MTEKAMSDERFEWLKDYLAPLPQDVASVTKECLREIERLRTLKERYAVVAGEHARREYDVIQENKSLRAENERLKSAQTTMERCLNLAHELAEEMRSTGDSAPILVEFALQQAEEIEAALRLEIEP